MPKNKEDEGIIDYYYNPNLECTCEGIFADTHRGYCKRRQRPMKSVTCSKKCARIYSRNLEDHNDK